MYGAIKTSARSAMGHAVADKRVYVHEALHLKGKLQAAGYKQAVEKWDSDSDSDESEDEDYAVYVGRLQRSRGSRGGDAVLLSEGGDVGERMRERVGRACSTCVGRVSACVL